VRSFFKDLFLWLVYFPYRRLVQILPFQVSYQLATWLGHIHYLLLPARKKRQIVTHLDLVFGPKYEAGEKKTILRRFCIHKQKELVDLFILGRKDYGRYLGACSEEGRSHLDQVLSRGQGAIALGFHFGSVNRLETYLADRGYKIAPFLVLPGTPGAGAWVSQQVLKVRASIWKERGNFQIITSPRSLLSMARIQYRSLNQNQIIDSTGDGALGTRFTYVDFFNVKLKVPLGPVLMAAKSGAGIVPSFAIRRGDNVHHFVFKAPIYVESEDEGALKKAIREYISYLEHYISQHPDRWTYWTRMEVEGDEDGIPRIRLILQWFLEAEPAPPA